MDDGDGAVGVGRLVVERRRDEPRLQAEDARGQLQGAAAGPEMAEDALRGGHRDVPELGSDGGGLDPVHVPRRGTVGVDVADVAGPDAGPVNRRPDGHAQRRSGQRPAPRCRLAA